MDKKIIEAIQLAENYYSADKLKHAMRVMCYAEELCIQRDYDDKIEIGALIVAIFHDIIEDTNLEINALPSYCGAISICGKTILSTIELLTHDKSKDSYDDYIDKIFYSNDILAKLVKAADMKDHLAQVNTLDDKLLQKYKPHIYKFIN